MKNSLNTILSILFIALLSACATAGTQKAKDQNLISQVQKGVTSQSEIYSMFGEPQVKAVLEDGTESWEYAYAEAQVTGATFIPIVGIFAGGANTQVHGVTFNFNKNSIVSGIKTTQGTVKSQNMGHTETDLDTVEH